MGAHAARVPGDALMSVERAPARVLELLRPRAGLSDRLREEITAAGWQVRDTPEGPLVVGD